MPTSARILFEVLKPEVRDGFTGCEKEEVELHVSLAWGTETRLARQFREDRRQAWRPSHFQFHGFVRVRPEAQSLDCKVALHTKG